MKRLLFFLLLCPTLITLQGQSFTCLTYNIRYDNPGDGENSWSRRRDFLAAQIRFHAPDVFGIQEGLHHQVEFLKTSLPDFAAIGAGRDDGKEAGEYSALFYRRDRFKVLDSGTFWLSPTPDRPSKGWDAALNRICTYALLQDRRTRRKIWIFNTHFDHVGQVAREQSAALILKIAAEKNKGNHALIVMGDLNSEPDEAPTATFKEKMSDAKERSAVPPFGPEGTFNAFKFYEPVKRRIDYIFSGGGKSLKVTRYAVLSDSKDCHYPSDHLPVLAGFQWQ